MFFIIYFVFVSDCFLSITPNIFSSISFSAQYRILSAVILFRHNANRGAYLPAASKALDFTKAAT